MKQTTEEVKILLLKRIQELESIHQDDITETEQLELNMLSNELETINIPEKKIVSIPKR